VVKVSAIVSLYNAERFVRGRLDDLLAQTLYQIGQLEIVIVNSGSKQGERYIIRDYLGCVTYIESLREPIYTAWNRGISIATGEYVTNANADDRLRPDALETLATALDERPDVGLVYADAFVISNENARWGEPCVRSAKPPYNGRIAWPDFDPKVLLSGYIGGPNPMWRRHLHAEYGLFDESYQLSGDYEFALRLVANGVKFHHIPQELTLFYDDGAGFQNQEQSGMEARRALLRWRGLISG
jgi:glycosyltransferase involved in cell wall biosynthesis